MSRKYSRSIYSCDGSILNVASSDLGNAATRYTYFNLGNEGYKYFSLQHIITATTLTLEACNADVQPGTIINSVSTGTDATGATIIASTLNTVNGFSSDNDLIGCYVRIIADSTIPANVGLIREITAYTASTGTIVLSSSLGATTNGITQFRLEDNPNSWSRMVSDPTGSRWTDVSLLLTGSATHTASGIWIVDTNVSIERFRIKRLTTNATNSLRLQMTRSR